MLESYHNRTIIGRRLRAIDAERYLARLDTHEVACSIREVKVDSIADSVRQTTERSRFTSEYLLRMGIYPHERHRMRTIVEGIVRTGRETLREAACMLNETDHCLPPAVLDRFESQIDRVVDAEVLPLHVARPLM